MPREDLADFLWSSPPTCIFVWLLRKQLCIFPFYLHFLDSPFISQQKKFPPSTQILGALFHTNYETIWSAHCFEVNDANCYFEILHPPIALLRISFIAEMSHQNDESLASNLLITLPCYILACQDNISITGIFI